MTVNQHSVWSRVNVYQNPNVINTPHERNPNNVTGTVNHFSKRRTLRKYVAPEGWQCNGLAVMGEPELFDFWCVIKPAGRKDIPGTQMDIGGELAEGELLLYYNPYHPNHPLEGIHLQLSSDESDYSGFADVVEYQWQLWIVRKHYPIDIDYGDSDREYIGKAIIQRWNQPAHTSSQNEKSHGHYQLQ